MTKTKFNDSTEVRDEGEIVETEELSADELANVAGGHSSSTYTPKPPAF